MKSDSGDEDHPYGENFVLTMTRIILSGKKVVLTRGV
jgi:hypothetical protein